MIALLAQAACGSSSTPTAATSPPSPRGCKAITVPSQQLKLDPTDKPTAGFKLPSNTSPVGIVRDNDGTSVWVLGSGLDTVLHVMPTGDATAYQLQTSGLGFQLSQAPDGTVWVPEQSRDAVLALAANTGDDKECFLPGNNHQPAAASVARDGSVWVSESAGGAIAHLVDGKFTEYPIGQNGVQGVEVVADADGGAWFSVMGGRFLGHISAQGAIERIPISNSGSAIGLLQTPDGAVWVADFGGDRLIRVAKDRTLTSWTAPSGAKPQGLALGPAGVVWVTESGADRLASVRGSALEQDFQTGSWPDHLAITSDGRAWFTEYNDDRLGRIQLPAR